MSKSSSKKISIEGYYDLTNDEGSETSSPKNLLENEYEKTGKKETDKVTEELTPVIVLLDDDDDDDDNNGVNNESSPLMRTPKSSIVSISSDESDKEGLFEIHSEHYCEELNFEKKNPSKKSEFKEIIEKVLTEEINEETFKDDQNEIEAYGDVENISPADQGEPKRKPVIDIRNLDLILEKEENGYQPRTPRESVESFASAKRWLRHNDLKIDKKNRSITFPTEKCQVKPKDIHTATPESLGLPEHVMYTKRVYVDTKAALNMEHRRTLKELDGVPLIVSSCASPKTKREHYKKAGPWWARLDNFVPISAFKKIGNQFFDPRDNSEVFVDFASQFANKEVTYELMEKAKERFEMQNKSKNRYTNRKRKANKNRKARKKTKN